MYLWSQNCTYTLAHNFHFEGVKIMMLKLEYFILKCDLCIRLVENMKIDMSKHLELYF